MPSPVNSFSHAQLVELTNTFTPNVMGEEEQGNLEGSEVVLRSRKSSTSQGSQIHQQNEGHRQALKAEDAMHWDQLRSGQLNISEVDKLREAAAQSPEPKSPKPPVALPRTVFTQSSAVPPLSPSPLAPSPVLSRSPSPVIGSLQASFAHAGDIKATFGEAVTFLGSRPTELPPCSPTPVAAALTSVIDQQQMAILHNKIAKVKSDLIASYDKKPALLLDKGLARFNDITAVRKTAVGKDLSANQITIAGKKIAIATQYPKDDQIARQLDMYMTQGVNTVVILSSDTDFNNLRSGRKLTNYFSQSATFTDAGKGSKITVKTAVKQRESEKLPDGSELRTYQMTLTNAKGQQKQMQVLHLANWPDHGVISAQDTLTLAKRLEGKDVAVHCTAGVGRTGVVVAAKAMNELKQQPGKASLETVITEMRQQRSPHMVQTEGQEKLLAEVATNLNFPIVSRGRG